MFTQSLRSISLCEDLLVPRRLAHYRPTAKSLPAVRAVFSGQPTIVTAVYGSGKSLSAGIGALAVANHPEAMNEIAPVLGRLERIDPELSGHMHARMNSSARGRAVVLSGYVRDLPRALATNIYPPPPRKIRQADLT